MVIILVVVKGTGNSFWVTHHCIFLPEISQESNLNTMKNTELKKRVDVGFFINLMDQIKKSVQLIALIMKKYIGQEK